MNELRERHQQQQQQQKKWIFFLGGEVLVLVLEREIRWVFVLKQLNCQREATKSEKAG
ncbi:hypothetical protein JHK85_013460 [Glycine max]|uniref:Uncharacterized protein n=1 Tax=Glycine max TaxID=3847 RepID=K7KQH6_SOYBN|nr:hypothetical protein JHK85_013460 [Glycine max]KAH1134651.1 hypothetical protein GYH30_012805 [Glycine max]